MAIFDLPDFCINNIHYLQQVCEVYNSLDSDILMGILMGYHVGTVKPFLN